MTREKINDFKKIVLPSISKFLLDVDYEGQGKCDAEEFAKDFNEILDLASKALEQEPCDDCVSRSALLEFFKDDDYVVNEINNMPPVLPKREKSKWKSTTNQEKLATITAEEFYEKIMWLLHDYGKRYTNSRLAIIEWLQAESEEKA